jgi:nucleotide-binding universal stress UspA family protein
MNTLTYFVPVDFSDCSYNALQYAILLARTSGGRVKLSHVIDLEDLPESENPVVVNWNLDRLNRKAKSKMNSLMEIVSMEGVAVEQDIIMGNVRHGLMKQIKQVNPHIIVVGKNTQQETGSGIIRFLARNTKIPVLVVPGSHQPTIPTRAVLASDMKPDKLAHYEPFLNIVKNTSRELAILLVDRNSAVDQDIIKEWTDKLRSEYGISAQLIPTQKNGRAGLISDFIRSNKVDLLCMIRRSHGFFGGLFNRTKPGPIIPHQVEVPVLVINS